MGTYANLVNVKDAAPQVSFDSDSRPTDLYVANTLIPDVEREVEATLGNLGITTPLTTGSNPKAFEMVREGVVLGVVARALRIRSYGASDPERVGAPEAEKMYRAWMKRLADPNDPYELPDATMTDEQVLKDEEDRVESHATELASTEFDAVNPSVTRQQVF